jgi:hypothetical protein
MGSHRKWLLNFGFSLLMSVFVFSLLSWFGGPALVLQYFHISFWLIFAPLLVPIIQLARLSRPGAPPTGGEALTDGEMLIHVLAVIVLVLALISSGLPRQFSNLPALTDTLPVEPGGAPGISDPQSSPRFSSLDLAIVKDIASILIIYFLTEMAAVIYGGLTTLRDTRLAMDNAVSALGNAQKTLGTVQAGTEKSTDQLSRLVNSVPFVREATKLPDKLHTPLEVLIHAMAESSQEDSWLPTVLSQYLGEEKRVFTGGMSEDEMPPSVNLNNLQLNISPQTFRTDVRNFVTHVGFFHRLLAEIVRHEQSLSMAIITNVLPAHWWDWPVETEQWRSFEPIGGYRDALGDAGKRGTRVDRVILVRTDGTGESPSPMCPLWSVNVAKEMKKWQLYRRKVQNYTHPKKIKYLTYPPGKVTEHYPIIDEPNAEKGYAPLIKSYNDFMHPKPEAGSSSYFPVTESVFLDESSGFGRFNDVMFLGEGQGSTTASAFDPKSNNPAWKLALVASMAPGAMSMFLTVVHGGLVKDMWDRFRLAVDEPSLVKLEDI